MNIQQFLEANQELNDLMDEYAGDFIKILELEEKRRKNLAKQQHLIRKLKKYVRDL